MDKQGKVNNTPYEVHGHNVKDVKVGDDVFINDKSGVVEKIDDKGIIKGFHLYKIKLTNGQIINIFRRY